MAAGDLCVLADVRALMQKKTADTAQDPLISSLIVRASAAVMRAVDREFAPVSALHTTRTFEFPWEGEFVSLAPYDLQTLDATGVVIDTDQATSITLTSDQYRVWPQPQRDGTIQAIRIRPFSAVLGRTMWRNRQVQITGTWGFPSIPADVTQATAETVVHWLTVNTAAFRRPDDDPNLNAVPRRGLPPSAWQILQRYQRASTA